MTRELQIRLLGGVEIALAGELVTAFMSNKAPALLAYLAVTRRTHLRDLLATLLWGEMSEADAKNNLRQVLTNLRKLVDSHLLVTRDTIGFNLAADYVLDVEAFDRHLRASRDSQSSDFQSSDSQSDQLTKQQAEHLQQAVALYRGDFLAGFFVRDAPEFEEWMLVQRARLHDRALYALHRLTSFQLGQADYGQAIDSASRSLSIDPWREEAHRHLMIALARSGQRSAALAQYRHCQRILQAELGVEPSVETRTLYARIRATGESIPHNLPPQPTAFVGRPRELAEIETSLLKPDCRLLTLVGMGGAGKTCLALRAAERLLHSGAFLNGVYFVSLVALDSADLLASAIAEACGLTFAGNKNEKSQLIDFLHSQEVLLLLDNFEQILDAAGWLSELLQRAPGVKLLVTTRVRLNIRWEWLSSVEGLEDADAVELFVQRAQLVDRHFALDAQTRLALAQIVQLVQGLPLAIELAAASVRFYTCQQIADSLAQTLDLLSSQLRDVPERQRSVRAVFDYSWRQLSVAEQQVLQALSVFQGSFTQVAATALFRETPHLSPNAHLSLNVQRSSQRSNWAALLATLVDQSLVQHNKTGRFQLHELIRQYAAEKLALQPEQQVAIQRTHAHHYAAWVEEQAGAIVGATQQQSLRSIEQEIDNVRAAWMWATGEASPTLLTAMIDTLFEFYEVRSLVQEASERFGQALAALQHSAQLQAESPEKHPEKHPENFQAASKRLLTKLLNRQARFLTRLGRRSEAEGLLQQSCLWAQELGLDSELGMALNYRGLLSQASGEYSEAMALFRASTDCCERVGDENGMARAFNNLGVIQLRLGNLSEAESHLQAALQLRRHLGNPKLIGDSLNNLGILQHELKNFSAEAALLGEALQNFQQLGDRKGIGVTLHNLGGVHLALQEYEPARGYLEDALTYRHADPAGLGNTLNNLGTVALRAGDRATAARRFVEALHVTSTSHDMPMTLDILVGMAELLLSQKRNSSAFAILNAVLPQAHDSDTHAEAERLMALTRNSVSPAAQVEAVGMVPTLEQVIALALREVGR